MISDQLANWASLPGFKQHPIWLEAFNWISSNAHTAETGLHRLSAPDFFVRVMEYNLKEHSQAVFESHLHTIDIQYTIKGAEGIEVMPITMLTPKGEYNLKNDVQLYQSPKRSAGRIDNIAGTFSIFFPPDGHMPQLQIPGHTYVKKLVIKIPVVLVTSR